MGGICGIVNFDRTPVQRPTLGDAWVSAGRFISVDELDQIWLNDGSGVFSDTLNSLGSGDSYGLALGDTDGDGDVDVFVANGSPNAVWSNQPEADGGDGFPDTVDNCPGVMNPEQKDMNNNGTGNQCDDDADGDGEPNARDLDDDNDGILDGPDDAVRGDYPRDGWDPDRDNDGIIDGLDRDPDMVRNLCTTVGPDADMNETVDNIVTCADSSSITVKSLTRVEGTGDLELIAPTVGFEGGFEVQPSGRLKVISKDPTAPIPNPPDG